MLNFNTEGQDLTGYFDPDNLINEEKRSNIERFYNILDSDLNSEEDLKFFNELSEESFSEYISLYAAHIYQAHIEGEGFVNELSSIHNLILWSCVQAGILKGYKEENIRFKKGETSTNMHAQSSIPFKDLKDILITFKVAKKKVVDNTVDIYNSIRDIMQGPKKPFKGRSWKK